MGKKSSNLTKKRIVSAAWKLFYEQGYENTTIDEIVEESCTSRGSFYHFIDIFTKEKGKAHAVREPL